MKETRKEQKATLGIATEAASREYKIPIDDGRLQQQDDFVYDWDVQFRVMSGGVGSGKSLGLVKAIYYLLVAIPGNRGFLARLDGKELRQTTMTELWNILPEEMIEKKNDQLGYLKLKNRYGGSELLYGDLKETRAIQNYNLGFFAVDQMEEIDKERFELLVGRLRKKTPFLNPQTGEPFTDEKGDVIYAPTFGLGACNPGAKTHFIYKYFHKDSPERKPNYQMYEVTTYDGLASKFVTDEYVQNMCALYPENMQKRLLLGEWGAFEGKIYPTFEESIHVIYGLRPKASWYLYESIDHGIKNATAVGWYATDEDGNVFLLDEHYVRGQPAMVHAAAIKAKRAYFADLGLMLKQTWLDAQCWAKDQMNGAHIYSISDEYKEHGIFTTPSQKDKKAGINRVTEHLAVDPTHRHPLTGAMGAPRLYVNAGCRNFIEEIQGYTWKKSRGLIMRNEPDMPVDYNDHLMDGLSYFLLSRPQLPIIKNEKLLSPLEQWNITRKKYNPLAQEVGSGQTWMSR